MERISRRQSLILGVGAGAAFAGSQGEAQTLAVDPMQAAPALLNPLLAAPLTKGSVALERESEHTITARIHGGKGRLTLRKFGFDNAEAPAGFVTFVIAPGSSEGVHTHGIGLPTGPFDEYYYVLAGAGEMSMDGKIIPVTAGDHVHAPIGVAHGIENTMAEGDLKVLITYIRRA